MSSKRTEQARRGALGVVGLIGFGALWEGYKGFGRAVNDHVFGWRLPAHTDDASMPHLWSILSSLTKTEVAGTKRKVWQSVLSGSWFTLRIAVVGLAIGVLVGMLLAIVMQRFKLVERAWFPYVVLSQTVPLVALAPILVSMSSRWKIGSWQWPPWMSVALMAAYLAFFPVAVGTLRGLQSPNAQALELMNSYAATSRQTLWKLRFPAAVPYILPALRLAAASAVVGAIVAELSAAVKGGIGRLILDYFQRATGDPARVFTAFLGAAMLGLVVAGLVALFERMVMRNRVRVEVGTP
jgi:NitT/TauT family transport system permease protein